MSSYKRILIVICSAILIFLIYDQGTKGTLYYDDYANLDGLRKINDFGGALHFISSGFAGPLGRPVALASFAAQAEYWPTGSRALLRLNVCIHILNAILIGVISYRILRDRFKFSGERGYWAALSSALLWAALPLLVSTTLITVQRMTSLSATFTLMGLLGFIYFQRGFERAPLRNYCLGMSSLGIGTIIGMFTKENAALTPVFALWLVLFFYRDIPAPWRYLRNIPLIISLLSLLYYISPLHRDWFQVLSSRGWSPWERLQTEAVVLWDYIRLVVAPIPSAFSPFHDDYPDMSGTQTVIFAGLGWLAVFSVAAVLAYKAKNRWLLFALLWFLTGHLLESTTPSLELMFEHRNYLALWGMGFALTYAAFTAKGELGRVAPALLGLLIVFQLAVLSATTSLWGRPQLALAMWSDNTPGSGRALSHALLVDPRIGGISPVKGGSFTVDQARAPAILQRMDKTLSICPECMGVRLQALSISCASKQTDDIKRRLREAIDSAASGYGRSTEVRPAYDQLFELRNRVNNNECGDLTPAGLYQLINTLLVNRYFQHWSTQRRLLFLAAAVSEDAGDLDRRDRILAEAAQRYPETVPILQYRVYSSINEGRYQDAFAAIDSVRRRLGASISKETKVILDDMAEEIEYRRKHDDMEIN